MPRRARSRSALSLALALAALGARSAPADPTPALVRANFDTTCAPCRDFFRFANGGWLAHAKVPAAYSSWGSFDVLQEQNRDALHEILEAARPAAPSASDSGTRMLGTFYGACMDSGAAEKAGLTPIAPLLEGIDRLASPADLARELGWLHAQGVPGMFAFRAAQDPRNSDLMIAFAGQGGLGLPDRDYYFRADSANRALRAAYVVHIGRLLTMAGADPAAARADADRIMALETALAATSMTNVERRDPVATYHKLAVDSLGRIDPRFGWPAYFERRGLGRLDSVNVTQPRFFHGLDSLLAAVPLPAWKAYLRWRVVSDAAPLLTAAFASAAFDFDKLLTGAQVMQPRWKRCLRLTDLDLGDVLGRAYVDRHFTPVARQRALAMVHNLEAALGERLAALDWMGDETRRQARAKLDAFANKIGYPDTWRDYAGVELKDHALLANHLSARAWEQHRQLAKIGKPVDRGEWTMTPPTVNAYYSSSLNSINFPAGILRPPFYDPAWDDGTNYGGIGAVIGHEMTHGFDDRGRQFDARGNLRDWWTREDAARYKERADKVAAQFSSYTVLDTLHLNGRLTLGENIADLGGLAVAYQALEQALGAAPRTRVDGFTPEQRFFLSYAQVWRELTRDEDLRTQVQTDPHSPARWRVDGPLSNLPEFAKAFGCKPGDAMVRDESKRARIW